MKKILTVLMMMIVTAIFAADPIALINEAKDAVKAKDFKTAVAKYGEAEAAAVNSVQAHAAIKGKFLALRSLKELNTAKDYMLKSIENEKLSNLHIRDLINELSRYYIWGSKPQREFALNLLKQAQSIEVAKNSNQYYRTLSYLSTMYLNQLNQPETVIELMQEIPKITAQHPSNKHNACYYIGSAYEKLGKKEEALKYYKEALSWAKKVTYKYNTKNTERAIERLSK